VSEPQCATLSESQLQTTALGLLPQWDLADAHVALIAQVENVVFRVVALNGARYVLRIHRPGYHTLAELESERLWTSALTVAGIDAPLGLTTRAGQQFVSIKSTDPQTVAYVGLTAWLEGEPMWNLLEQSGQRELLLSNFDRLGALAAKIHNQASDWDLPPGFTRHALDIDGLLGEQPFWGRFWESPAVPKTYRTTLKRLSDQLRRTLAEIPTCRQHFGLIHADLHPGNVLVDGNVLRVIDFDDAGFGWHVYDLAIALFHYKDHPHYGAIRDALVAGYRRSRPLSGSTVALLPMFFIVRALSQIGWIAQRPELGMESKADKHLAWALQAGTRWYGTSV
jgi:Ser/Thr protein kinase RdoA (MazF antagonist)